jgi:hypothetical protein
MIKLRGANLDNAMSDHALSDYARRGCTLDHKETRHRTYPDIFLR